MVQGTMRDPMDDIARQARQGSVAAIIQTLNEQLADGGVRTRAVFAEGVLQLLCEAAETEQLKQSVLVAKIRQILENIAPRNIRRVRINSRIVREQQLLWLEEINRDPENQLLWSEEIILRKPNFFKQLLETSKNPPAALRNKPPLPKVPSRYLRNKNPYYRRGIVSGVSVSLLLMFVGWLLHDRIAPKLNTANQLKPSNKPSLPSNTSSPADPFVQAVRLAEQAAVGGKTVQTSAQWLDIAAKWERASDLMGTVKPDDVRYQTARNRMNLYRQNSEAAQKQAAKRRS